ncbi:syntaxin-binding 1 isoform X1 [Brachionus plicatilis]|uniref:Syntaxin-binding 1 isoform X1 n=1 Tax=Brachionus plicatilis TaxID=10195 RepID=A0A3M7TA04_BRAPC|nr:syntaxin-binding 1 isoform X1 [Brachionus plicatilis]
MSAGLQLIVGQKIMNDVLRADTVRKKGDWKVLVMDNLGMRIISSCCKMHDIMSEGVTIVEDIMKNREPLPQLEAIYLIQPTRESIDKFIGDFDSNNIKYRAAHLFFTEGCNNELFNKLSKSKAAKYVQTLKEINVAFLPTERQVFSLDSPDTFRTFYQNKDQYRSVHLERIAEQIATLCATLGEYPSVRYRLEHQPNNEFANLVQQKLDQYKADDPSMGDGGEKNKSQLLILDRGFDPVSPLLHELTFQAMAYDLLSIENDVYQYQGQTSDSNQTSTKEAILDESDELWIEFRHQHIAVVSQNVTKKLKDFANSKRASNTDKPTMKDLSQMLKKMPQYQKELSAYALHLNLAESCVSAFNNKIKQLCDVEQNLAMGMDSQGEKIKDHMKNIVPLLLDNEIKTEDKLRLIMLFLLNKNGITEENLQKLLHHAMIPEEKKQIILNLQQIGLQILQDQNKRRKNIPQNRRERDEQKYQLSRWTPYVRDLMEDAIEEKLDQRQFPYLTNRPMGGVTFAGSSARPTWHRNNGQPASRSTPRLIVFIIGGLTYSEMRSAYEVTAANKKWEVMIGSDHILTPKSFLANLEMRTRDESRD